MKKSLILITSAAIFCSIVGCKSFARNNFDELMRIESPSENNFKDFYNLNSTFRTIAKTQTKCSVEAYGFGIAETSKTANVRVKPDKNSEIVKTITTIEETIFSITGSDGKGWFEISKIETTGGDEDKTLFAGRGWVHASNLDLSVADSDARLYAAPSKKSRVVKKLIGDESEARPLACQGDWMQIKSGASTGWLSREGQCANPLTTCS